MSQDPKIPQVDRNDKVVVELSVMIKREVVRRCGKNSDFERRRDVAAAIASEALWLDEQEGSIMA